MTREHDSIDPIQAKELKLQQLIHSTEQEITNNIFKPYKPELAGSLDFLHNVEFSHQLSGAARQRFQDFAERFDTPETAYTHIGQDGNLVDWAMTVEDLAQAHPNLKEEDLELAKQSNRMAFYAEEQPTRTEEKREKYLRQDFVQKQNQPASPNVIKEYVLNALGEDFNIANAELTVSTPKDGIMFELNQLLPDRFEFSPRALEKTKIIKVPIETQGLENLSIPKEISVPANLNDYAGLQTMSEGILDYHVTVYKSGKGKIFYGDLTKSGGFLALFHEIGHAWQSVYRKAGYMHEFQKLYSKALSILEILKITFLLPKSEDPELSLWRQVTFINPFLKDLESLGIKIDLNTFLDENKTLDPSEFRIKNPTNGNKFTISSKMFGAVIESCVKEEQEPWQNAVQVLQFLRENDLDLEPELKTEEDIRYVVLRGLKTYDNFLSNIEMGTKINGYV
jgi:hypothetical protein